jgi:hypothetical protein
MATFRIVQYPKYIIPEEDSNIPSTDRISIFPKQQMLLQWEAVVELHAIFEMVSLF